MKNHSPRPRKQPTDHTRRQRGLSLVELLLSLSITVLIGSSIAGMLLAATSASTHQKTNRNLSVWQGMITARLGSLLRSASAVLASEPDSLVLWMADSDRNGEPSAAEITILLRNRDTNKLRCYRPFDSLSSEKNIPYTLDETDFRLVPLLLLKDNTILYEQLWADGVLAMDIQLDTDNPFDARFVSYHLTVNIDGVKRTTLGGAALRN